MPIPPQALPSDPPMPTETNYVNRELSWMQFNRRVLEEARDPSNPLLERVKFLAIASNNLDEFFEVRVAGTMEKVDAGVPSDAPDRVSPVLELDLIRKHAAAFIHDMHRCWLDELVPALAEQGIHFRRIGELDATQQEWLLRHFQTAVFPVLTPLAIDPAHPFPSLLSKSLNLAVMLRDERGSQPIRRIAVVQVPRALPRLLEVPAPEGERHLVFMGALVREHVAELFPGLTVESACTFRMTRDSNIDVDEDTSESLLSLIEKELVKRRRGEPVRLEVSRDAPPEILERFLDAFGLEAEDVYYCDGPVNLARLMELYETIDDADLRDPRFQPRTVAEWTGPEVMFQALRDTDLLLHHPYDSFKTVEEFVHHASRDARVLAIKMTVYRLGDDSSIVQDLISAAENRKQVTVVVELKARYDEESNIRWAKRLERAGVHVVYGIVGLKTHCKACLVVRREEDRLRRYCHLSTGNYNPTTARIYTDIGLLTAREPLCEEVADVFNMITGYARVPILEELVVSPFEMRDRVVEWIRKEAENAAKGKPARIRAKFNALADSQVIEALYDASKAGVSIDLCIRGICCLRPGIPGLSDNIRVVSVVDRFLEHSRIYEFHNGGEPRLWVGSADLMYRNLSRRVEILFPMRDPEIAARVTQVLDVSFRDNLKARRILPDGTFERVAVPGGEKPFRMQAHLIEQAGRRASIETKRRKRGKKRKRA